MSSSRDEEEGGVVREDEQRDDEEIAQSEEGHVSLRSTNPRHSSHGLSHREAENLRMESADLVVASEFGGYFVNSETRLLAVLTAVISLAAAAVVVGKLEALSVRVVYGRSTSQHRLICCVVVSMIYRAYVLDPDCVLGPNNTLVDPDCETGGFLTEVSVALTVIVSLVIPGFGIYGSWTKQEVHLQVFRFL